MMYIKRGFQRICKLFETEVEDTIHFHFRFHKIGKGKVEYVKKTITRQKNRQQPNTTNEPYTLKYSS